MNTPNNNQELFVITRTQTGFSIHAMDNPYEAFRIKGDELHSTCTCKDYANHYTNPKYKCKHIKVVHDLWDVPCDIELQSFI